MPSERFRAARSQGFTMIELIVVIVVLGVLATMAYSTGPSPLEASKKAHADALRSHIRYAQSRAMTTGRTYGINCDGTAYWLFVGSNATVATPLPGESAATVTAASRDITVTTFVVAFDSAGRPYSDATLLVPLGVDQPIVVSSADDNTESVTLTLYTETGYVE